MKILSLFSSVGIGETLIHKEHPLFKFTAVEIIPKLANEYKLRFPGSEIIINDAYSYFYGNHHKYDIIFASPPCQSYSKLSKMNNPNLKPDERIKGLIKYLQEFVDEPWIVENVDAFYLRTIPGFIKIGRHLFWSNKSLQNDFVYPERTFRFDKQTDAENGLSATQTYVNRFEKWLNIRLSKRYYIRGNHDPGQIYREGIHPLLFKYVFDQIVQ